MSEFVNLEYCCDFIKNAEDVLILCHKNPDGDTVGSAFGLKGILLSLGKRAKVRCSDEIPDKFDYFTKEIVGNEDFEPKTIITVDIPDEKLLGSDMSHFASQVDLAIDHHRTHKPYAKKIFVNSEAPAAAEIIFSISEKMNLKLDVNTANAMFTGICTDTGGFRYEGTSSYTHMAAAKLMEFGAKSTEINKRMFSSNSRSKMELEMRVLNNIQFFFDEKCAMITIFLKDVAESGAKPYETEGMAPIPTTIEGVELGLTLKEIEDGFKVSVRTVNDISASDFCSEFGGGGHIRAAGCFIKGTYEETVKKLLQKAEEYLSK